MYCSSKCKADLVDTDLEPSPFLPNRKKEPSKALPHTVSPALRINHPAVREPKMNRLLLTRSYHCPALRKQLRWTVISIKTVLIFLDNSSQPVLSWSGSKDPKFSFFFFALLISWTLIQATLCHISVPTKIFSFSKTTEVLTITALRTKW